MKDLFPSMWILIVVHENPPKQKILPRQETLLNLTLLLKRYFLSSKNSVFSKFYLNLTLKIELYILFIVKVKL